MDILKLTEKELLELIREIAIQGENNEDDREKRIKEIKSNYRYVEWLEKFTLDKVLNTDYIDLYSEDDQKMAKEAFIFFKAIEEYASEIGIKAEFEDCESIYYFCFNGINFKLTLVIGQGAYIYCERITNTTGKTIIIDFHDIVQSK